jgi:hypothetical protein
MTGFHKIALKPGSTHPAGAIRLDTLGGQVPLVHKCKIGE